MKRLLIGTAACGLALGFSVLPASAQVLENECQNVSPTPPACIPEVQAESLTVHETPPAQVQTAPHTAPAAQTLPVTGGDVVGLALVGAGAVAGGAALMAVRRRKVDA
jgi:LPXTG-motif cell wall-anchored protein